MLDDLAAVEQARLGDERAWRRLYESHSDLIFRVALRKVGDREAALDIVQETYVKASRGIAGYRGEASFRSWLVSIALNEARTWIRRKLRKREVSIESIAEPVEATAPADVTVARMELAGRALEFIQKLPDQQRDAVLLRTTEGLAYREIAHALGTSEGSVRVSYHHGMAKLRDYMRDFVDAREETAEEAAAPEHSRPRSGARAGHETGYGREARHGNEAAPDV